MSRFERVDDQPVVEAARQGGVRVGDIESLASQRSPALRPLSATRYGVGLDPLLAVGILVTVAILIWPVTIGRRYFMGRRRTIADVRRDLYTSSLDEGMYPLTPPRGPDGTEEERPPSS